MSKSAFIFRPHKAAADERKTHGLVDVYDRETGGYLGMMNPHTDGGYTLRDRNGVRLGANNDGHVEDLTYVSRETSAGILRQRIAQHDRMLARRVGRVSEGCPNNWHNTSEDKATTPCPECPTQPGLQYAVQLLEHLGYGVAEMERLKAEIYTPAS